MATPRKKHNPLSEEFLATATPKEMAAAWCHVYDRRKFTAEESKALTAKFKTMKPSQTKEFQRYTAYYWAMLYAYYPLLKIAQGMFEREANAVLSKLLCVNADRLTAIALSTIYRNYKKEAKGEEELRRMFNYLFNPASKTFTDKIHLTFEGDKVSINEAEILEDISREIREDKVILDSLEGCKAAIVALEEWTEEYDLREFIPNAVRVAMEEAKEDYAAKLGLQRYSLANLWEREEKGETITEEERKAAILPCYEDIEPSAGNLEMWINKLEETYNAYK